jgi:hypothetical protein
MMMIMMMMMKMMKVTSHPVFNSTANFCVASTVPLYSYVENMLMKDGFSKPDLARTNLARCSGTCQ